jgi:CheY-like chemotaxis protein
MTEAWPQRPPLEAANLQRLLAALTAARDGDFGVRLPESADLLLDDISTAFNSLAERLSERATARERLLPTLSHELRTPLNSMLVLALLLSNNPDGNLTAEQVEYARVIHSAGTDLLTVISGLLDPGGQAAKPDESAARYAGQRLLVVEAARGGMLTLLARGAVSGLPDAGGPVDVLTAATADEVTGALEAGPPHCVVLDMTAGGELASAALELLRSRPGTRRVPVLAHARDDLSAARFAGLRDRPSELLRTPGELRSRIAWHLSAGERDAAGRRDASRGGAAERGTTVTGTAARSETATGNGASTGNGTGTVGRGHATLRGKKILVVDDDPRNVFAITSTLEHYGMTVLRSADGRAGIDQLRSEPDTDLVLMDLMMPGMDGYAAISAIREMPQFSDLPIIAVTAHTMTGELARGVPGADDCLTKPLDTDELLGRMARYLAS